MTRKTCGCSTASCGCCEGVKKLTPATILNRPALPALRYRVGTHGTFFATMQARLASMRFDAPGADGQTLETFQPLLGLTTRDASDPAIALLDAWAVIADVLTFYQERIANEGYLRTATERRSILELARLVGYNLRPGVAASVYLAYRLEDKQVEAVEIPKGARSQSVPGPDELPQTFETAEKIMARAEWNNLQVRLTRPLELTPEKVIALESFYVAGTAANLKKGDMLVFVFERANGKQIVRTVDFAEGQFGEDRTFVRLVPLPSATARMLPSLARFVDAASKLFPSDSPGDRPLFEVAERLLDSTYLGAPLTGTNTTPGDDDLSPGFKALLKKFAAELREALKDSPKDEVEVATPEEFTSLLLREPNVQFASSARLTRSLSHAFEKGSDAQAQLLVHLAPKLKDSYYTAWANAKVSQGSGALKGVYVMRVHSALFGANAPKRQTYSPGGSHGPALVLDPPSQWEELPVEGDELPDALFLENAHEAILPDSFAIIDIPARLRSPGRRQFVRVQHTSTGPRTAYGITGTSTRLEVAPSWQSKEEAITMADIRTVSVFAQSEPLTVLPSPIAADVGGSEIELAELYDGLVSGRWIILSGERADIPEVSGVRASELHMVAGVRQGFDSKLAGDKTHTTLSLATETAYRYKRDSLAIYANVVKATHGETRHEPLGSGNGSIPLQSFALRQPPLTFVSAPTPDGVESTLEVYVNDLKWHETDTLAALGAQDHGFATRTDDKDVTSVVFGDGRHGARLPSGVENVQAVYRNGIGQGGNVRAEQISLLTTKPLGIKSVLNPLRASGGADRETRDQARENAPLTVTALDRLVGLQDYSDFARTFAGIAKAEARRLSDGNRQIIHLTIAGADDIPIDPASDFHRNLLAALRKYGDEAVAVKLAARELIALVLSANVRLAPDHLWEAVAFAVRTALLSEFGFHKRALGQPALLCEVIGTIQNVPGVAYVDVDAFGGIPERTVERDKNNKPTGKRRLLTFQELADTVEAIVRPPKSEKALPPGVSGSVQVNLADFEEGTLRPAQLAIFTPAVPDTLILNQIP